MLFFFFSESPGYLWLWYRACHHQKPLIEKSLLILTEEGVAVKGPLIPSLFWFKNTNGRGSWMCGHSVGHFLVMKSESEQFPPGQKTCGLPSGFSWSPSLAGLSPRPGGPQCLPPNAITEGQPRYAVQKHTSSSPFHNITCPNKWSC